MKRVDLLREQSRLLRDLASSFDNTRMRRQLVEMAAQCEEWAVAREQALRAGREPPEEA
jgi:hypothetical protein